MKRYLSWLFGTVLVLALFVSVEGCGEQSSPPAATPPAPTSQTPMMPSSSTPPSSPGQSTPAHVARLGVVGEPSADRRGLLIREFTSSPTPSPLQVLGVKKGDVIISCNGQQGQLGLRINQAIDGLQTRGEPITVVVEREGKQVTLTRSERLP